MSHVAIVGAGPGGATLAYLLARNGVQVTLLERHTDFHREFRGEVLMPSGLEPFEQMGLWSAIDGVPQVRLRDAEIYVNGELRLVNAFDDASFEPYGIRWISQPGLLEMLVEQASRHPCFRIERGASVGGLVEKDGRVTGVTARVEGEECEIPTDLVIGADGRTSIVRRRGGFQEERDPTPMDVVWCKLPMLPELAAEPRLRAYLGSAHLLICAPIYGDCIQIGWIIPKGTYGEVRDRGIPWCLDQMAAHVSPDLAAHVRRHRNDAIETFLLSTVSDRVTEWSKPGVLLIGDAAHTMSPVGAQGINVAIRDAVVAANHLVPVLKERADASEIDATTRAIQAERQPDVQQIQRLQALAPRIIMNDTWWTRLLLAVGPRLAGSPLFAGRARTVFRRFAFGMTDVRLEV